MPEHDSATAEIDMKGPDRGSEGFISNLCGDTDIGSA